MTEIVIIITCIVVVAFSAYEPVNIGRLGTTHGWRIEKPEKEYY